MNEAYAAKHFPAICGVSAAGGAGLLGLATVESATATAAVYALAPYAIPVAVGGCFLGGAYYLVSSACSKMTNTVNDFRQSAEEVQQNVSSIKQTIRTSTEEIGNLANVSTSDDLQKRIYLAAIFIIGNC